MGYAQRWQLWGKAGVDRFSADGVTAQLLISRGITKKTAEGNFSETDAARTREATRPTISI